MLISCDFEECDVLAQSDSIQHAKLSVPSSLYYKQGRGVGTAPKASLIRLQRIGLF